LRGGSLLDFGGLLVANVQFQGGYQCLPVHPQFYRLFGVGPRFLDGSGEGPD